jgi:aromatic ring hydroxylase
MYASKEQSEKFVREYMSQKGWKFEDSTLLFYKYKSSDLDYYKLIHHNERSIFYRWDRNSLLNVSFAFHVPSSKEDLFAILKILDK